MSHAGLKITISKYHEFSAGEQQVEMNEEYLTMVNEFVISGKSLNNDIMRIAQTVDIIRQNNKDAKIKLKLMYMPYGRQDRKMASEGYKGSNALKVFANIINNMGIDEVITYDPHSDVTEAVFNNLTIISNESLVLKCLEELNLNTPSSEVNLVIPDVGASKKIYSLTKSLQKKFQFKINLHQCEKHRDVTTGEITHSSIPDSLSSLSEKTNVILIDDICDYGGSFKKIAEKAPHLDWNLVVSHCILPDGKDEMFKYFNSIFTTDSLRQEEEENLYVLMI